MSKVFDIICCFFVFAFVFLVLGFELQGLALAKQAFLPPALFFFSFNCKAFLCFPGWELLLPQPPKQLGLRCIPLCLP
jgi:hypothetical protein